MRSYQAVLDFWFSEENRTKHFAKDEAFDELIRKKFFATWQAACRGELKVWRTDIAGQVAEIIVLDQFSRNLFRTSELAFRQDELALQLARETVNHPDYQELPVCYKIAVLMPFMHAEHQKAQEESIAHFTALGDAKKLGYALRHKEIIDQFGRFPHRNRILGRKSTVEEVAFLEEFHSF